MEKCRIGKSDLYVNKRFGLGCMEIGGPMKDNEKFLAENDEVVTVFSLGKVSEKESVAALEYAFESGVNFLDTAPAYGAGNSEVVIGKALKGKRDSVIVATKFGKKISHENNEFGRYENEGELIENIRNECEQSLLRLNTDYIDLYQFHQLMMDLLEYSDEVLEILERLVEEGKIRYYGWSTENPVCAERFSAGPHCISIQFATNYLNSNHEILKICEEKNLGAICRGIFGMGFLTGKYTRENYDSLLSEDDFRRRFVEDLLKDTDKIQIVKSVFDRENMTYTEGALGWIFGISDITIPIIGFRNKKQVERNLNSLKKGKLPQSAIEEMTRLLA